MYEKYNYQNRKDKAFVCTETSSMQLFYLFYIIVTCIMRILIIISQNISIMVIIINVSFWALPIILSCSHVLSHLIMRIKWKNRKIIITHYKVNFSSFLWKKTYDLRKSKLDPGWLRYTKWTSPLWMVNINNFHVLLFK